jgi:hypothetical protein
VTDTRTASDRVASYVASAVIASTVANAIGAVLAWPWVVTAVLMVAAHHALLRWARGGSRCDARPAGGAVPPRFRSAG